MSEYHSTYSTSTRFLNNEHDEFQYSNSQQPPLTEQDWENGLQFLPDASQMRAPTPNTLHSRQGSSKDSTSSNRFRYSISILNGKELLGKVLGHIFCARIPEWREMEENIKSHIQSTAPAVLDTVNFRLKLFSVSIIAIGPKEIIGPVGIRDPSNWAAIIEELEILHNTGTVSKARQVSLEISAEFIALDTLNSVQDSLAMLASSSTRKVY